MLEKQAVLLDIWNHVRDYDFLNVLLSSQCSFNDAQGTSSARTYFCSNQDTPATVSVMLSHTASGKPLSGMTMDVDPAVVEVESKS